MVGPAVSAGRALLARYYALRGIGWLADQLLVFLVPVVTYKVTGSLAWASLALAVQWTPRLVALPLGGLVADRMDDRDFYLAIDLIRCVAGFTVAGLALAAPGAGRAALIVFAVIAGAACEQSLVAGEKLASRLVAPEKMAGAQSVLSGIEQAALVAAPALGGVLLLLSPARILLCVSGLFVASLLCTVTIPREHRRPAPGDAPAPSAVTVAAAAIPAEPGPTAAVPTPPRRGARADLAASLRTITRAPVLARVVAVTMCVNVLLGVLQGLAPVIVVRVFGRPETSLGVVYALAGLAAIATVTVVPRLIRRRGLYAVGAGAALGMVLSFTAMGFGVNYLLFAFLVMAMMVSDSVFAVYIRTVRITLVPRDEYGRTVSTIYVLNFIAVPVVGVLLAICESHVPLSALISGLGLLALPPVVLLLLRIRRLVAADAAHPADPAQSTDTTQAVGAARPDGPARPADAVSCPSAHV